MIVPGSANSLLLAQGASTGYNLTKSLRFRSSASAYLSRSQTSGNSQKWTWSGWVKRGKLGTGGLALFGTIQYPTPGNYQSYFYFNSDDTFEVFFYTGPTVEGKLTTTQVFRDPSAWYHIMVSVDTTLATADNRMRVYVNGSEVTAFTNRTNPSQNYNTYINNSASSGVGLGATYPYTASYFDGYMAEVNFVDGQQLTPSSFGENNATTGLWQPKRYTGTYGTNGFYLPFTDTTSTTTLGYDSSGNGNNWTTNNFSLTAGYTYDSMTDVPTLTSATVANYCVLNPLSTLGGASTANGNLNGTTNTTNGAAIYATMQIPNTGKWYWELTPTSDGNQGFVGIESQVYSTSASPTYRVAYYASTGDKYIDATNASYGATWTNNDVIGIAVDSDSGTVTFYKNNTSQGAITYSVANKNMFASFRDGGSSSSMVFNANFGQQPFTYTPPTGYVALNTYNLPTSTIVKGNTVMDATLYNGNGTTGQSITNAGAFKPDLVWIKGRNAAINNILEDSVRGVSKSLFSDGTYAEINASPYGVTAFNSNGFSVLDTNAGDNGVNGASGGTYSGTPPAYVGWQWQAGQGTTSSNTNGSITSTVSVNPTAGFSIVTYTGTGSAGATVGHGLGVTPQFILIKVRSVSGDAWIVWSGAISQVGYLNLTDAFAAGGRYTAAFNATAPTSSVITLGTSSGGTNTGSATYVAYCWTEIAGFSKFGSYTGNGSTDGTFVYLGFRPKFVMLKRSSGVENWQTYDSSRGIYNVNDYQLLPNSSSAEGTGGSYIDFISNGFKLRNSASGGNANGETYIYAAFAENPFKNALAR